MTDIVYLSSEDEMEVEDIVEVFDEPIEECTVDNPLIPDPLILQGLVSPEDLGISTLRSLDEAKQESDLTTLDKVGRSCTEKPVLNKIKKANQQNKCPEISNCNETEMRISISKKHSDTHGDSTQVKIVIPNAPVKSHVPLNKDSCLAHVSPSLQNDTMRNNQRKRTARKTMSSFTPRKQISNPSKKLTCSIVTLDSDEEKDCEVKHNLEKYLKSDEPDMPGTSYTTLTSLAEKPSTVTALIEETPIASLVVKKDEAMVKTNEPTSGQSLEILKESFATECKKYLTSVEFEKVQKKLEKRIIAISDRYKNNSRLREFLLDRIDKIKKDSEKLQKESRSVFLVIQDVLDELTKYGKKSSSAQAPTCSDTLQAQTTTQTKREVNSQSSTSAMNPERLVSEIPSTTQVMTDRQLAKRKLHIRKLENALKACGREISRCEGAEMGLDDLDDENSDYMKVSRYRARYMKIYRKIAQLRELNASLERKQDKKFKTEASRIPEINQKIEKLVNRDKIFPDFSDVRKIFVDYYKEKNLVIRKEVIEEEAKDTFRAVGQKLQARRIHDDADVMLSYIPSEHQDPANDDPELRRQLDESSKNAEIKMKKVVNDFVLKQVEIKEEAEEVPDDVIVNNKDEELSSEGDSEDDSGEDSDADEIPSNDTDIENTDSVLH